MKRALRIAGYALLGLAAAVGVALSAAFLLVSTDLGRGLVVPRLVRMADDALAGRIELRAIHLLEGGLELVGVRVIDPDGDEVLRADRLRVRVELRGLRSKAIGARVELDRPTLTLKREEDGTLSVARAFAPANPSPPKEKQEPAGSFDWTVRLSRLTIRHGTVTYVDERGRTAYQATDLDLDARAIYGPRGGGAELSLRGELVAPERAPLTLAAAAGFRGTEARVRLLRLAVGDTAVELAGQGDWATRKGRAAVLALAVDAAAVRRLAPDAPLAGDLAGTLYAESDGGVATAALDLRPAKGGGEAHAAAAGRLPPAGLAAGLDLRLEGLDLARVLRGAPSTDLHLAVRAHGAGKDADDLRGAASASLAPSRVRGGRIGRVELRASADRGRYELSRAEVSLPGLSLEARGRWRRGGAIAGRVLLDAADLAAARDDAEELLDRDLPEVSGALRISADVSGTEAAPLAGVRVRSPRIAAGGARADGVDLRLSLAGPAERPDVALDGTVARVAAGGGAAEGVRARARVQGRAGELAVTGTVPGLGPDSMELRAAGAVAPDGATGRLRTLELAWPGVRFALQHPATIDLRGPSVDELALASGPQRLSVRGGLRGAGAGQRLDARVVAEAIDLALLPRAVVPPTLRLAGKVSADVTARGRADAPEVAGHVALADGEAKGLQGLSARAELAYDGPRRRARAELDAARAEGGSVRVRADVPERWARAGRAAPLSLEVHVAGVPLAEVLRVAEVSPAVSTDGDLALDARLDGTFGAPRLAAEASFVVRKLGVYEAFDARAALAAGGKEATLDAHADGRGSRLVTLQGALPVDLAALLRDPASASALSGAPLRATLDVPGYDLARLAGKGSAPADLQGKLTAHAELSGTARAPRGTFRAAVADGAGAGYRAVGAEVELRAGAAELAAKARVAMEGADVARLTATLGLPPERAGDAAAREAAPLQARLELPRTELRRAGVTLPVAGALQGHATVAGSLAAPRADVDLAGVDLRMGGTPIGDVRLRGRAGGRKLEAAVDLAAKAGGALHATLDADADVGIAALRAGGLSRAPARATLVADRLDLAFLPGVAPGVVRSASGKLSADVRAAGPLARMSPRGTARLEGGRLSIVEYGEWKEIGLQASVSDDAVRVDELTARHRDGRVRLTAQVVGLDREGAPADLSASLRSDGLTLSRAGQDVITVDLEATAKGTVSADALTAQVDVPRATLKLPSRSPRKIQPLDPRPDILIGPRKVARGPAPAPGGAAARPFGAKVHLLAPGKLFVKSDNPRMNIELKADVTAETTEADLLLTGDVQTIRGQIEPIGGRIFDLRRGRVHFTGEDYTAGVLEVQALYENPAAKVNVTIGGTIEKPDIKLTSEPPMDDAQIALLIATGRTELKAGSGGAGGLTGEEAGKAALGAVATQVFKDVIADKLPVDSVAIDSSQLRAGKYVTDKIYVGYTLRYTAQAEQGENTNEVRVEYQISPRWTFESRYGDANTGGASLIWSKDY